MDFLVHIEIVRGRATEAELQALVPREAARARELAAAGVLRRLWRIPGRWANWGVWSAADAGALHEALSSLPFFPYMEITVHPLAPHPNDPGAPS
jgi:muconolactone D-isomerase